MTSSLDTFIEGMPKVELHMHLEGSLEPELMFALAERNKVEIPFKSVEEVRRAYNFSNLQDFLDIYYKGMSVLQTEEDFYELTMAYLKKVSSQNVVHTEVFFDPQGHTSRGVDFETALIGILQALIEGKTKFGISSYLIMCFLRHLSEEEAFATLKQALPHKKMIFGVGLDSSEKGNPPSRFQRVFAEAKKAGFKTVAHAGEEGPAQYVWEALDLLKVDRIDHGNHSLDDQALITRLIQDKMALTVCPLSNLKLRVVKDMKRHPLKKMLDMGIRATVNSDDPAYFGGYMNENYKAVADALNLERSHIETLAKNSIAASFLGEEAKLALQDKLGQYCVSVV